MNPTTGSACCCAHTAHGQQVTALPSATTMKSRRLMGPSPTPRKTIYHIVDRVRRLCCVTAAANVRYGSKADEIVRPSAPCSRTRTAVTLDLPSEGRWGYNLPT